MEFVKRNDYNTKSYLGNPIFKIKSQRVFGNW